MSASKPLYEVQRGSVRTVNGAEKWERIWDDLGRKLGPGGVFCSDSDVHHVKATVRDLHLLRLELYRGVADILKALEGTR